jgi:hypothetical protein
MTNPDVKDWRGHVSYLPAADGTIWTMFPRISAATREEAEEKMRAYAPDGAEIVSVSAYPQSAAGWPTADDVWRDSEEPR